MFDERWFCRRSGGRTDGVEDGPDAAHAALTRAEPTDANARATLASPARARANPTARTRPPRSLPSFEAIADEGYSLAVGAYGLVEPNFIKRSRRRRLHLQRIAASEVQAVKFQSDIEDTKRARRAFKKSEKLKSVERQEVIYKMAPSSNIRSDLVAEAARQKLLRELEASDLCCFLHARPVEDVTFTVGSR